MAGDECSIKVFCRFRPENENEKKLNIVSTFDIRPPDTIIHDNRTFVFDRVFDPRCTQEQVYAAVARPIVSDILNGYNGTIFAYGQTSSGKTHTMEGYTTDNDGKGILPRIIDDIFDVICSMDENLEFQIKITCFEIYLDSIRDLLDVKKRNLTVHEDKNKIPYVRGITEQFVSTPEEVMDIVQHSKKNRHVSVTNMNEHSSRSHSIFLINVRQENLVTKKKLTGKLYLVDLAGSEKVSKTGAVGTVLDEAKNINKSLSALGNVISALAEGAGFIPYRDSKITRVLQESLGGNAKTSIIICCSPSPYNEAETKSTLLFGQRAKTIKNTLSVNVELSAEEWKNRFNNEKRKVIRLSRHIRELEGELSQWRRGISVSPSEQCNRDGVLQKIIEEADGPLQEAVTFDKTTKDAVILSPTLPTTGMFRADSSDSLINLGDANHEACNLKILEKSHEVGALNQTLGEVQEKLYETETALAELTSKYNSLRLEHSDSLSDVKVKNSALDEMFKAIEDLTVDFEQKSQECNNLVEKMDSVDATIHEYALNAKNLKNELDLVNRNVCQQQNDVVDFNVKLLDDITELVNTCGFSQPSVASDALNLTRDLKIEDSFTLVRMLFHHLKSECKLLSEKFGQTNSKKELFENKIIHLEGEIANMKVQIDINEDHIARLQSNLVEVERSKRNLETLLDDLDTKNQILQNRTRNAQESYKDLETEHKDRLTMLEDKNKILRTKMESNRQTHQLQIQRLREEINSLERQNAAKDIQIRNFEAEVENLKRQKDTLYDDYHHLMNKSKESMMESKNRELALSELSTIKDTVKEEIKNLSNLKNMFADAVISRPKTDLGLEGHLNLNDGYSPCDIHAVKIDRLEENVDQLINRHKILTRENDELKRQVPKLEKCLKRSQERIQTLENFINKTRENNARDREILFNQIDRYQTATDNAMNIRKQYAHISKVIRPNQSGRNIT